MSVLNHYDALEDLLNFVLYISSDKVTCISGQIFNIDCRIK